jgi:hypothetical protein
MRSILRRRPSAATLISCFALFMALGGVSYGFAAGSIDSREILNDTVRGKDVHQETLTGSDVKNGKLGGADIASDSLGGGDIAPDSLGGEDVAPDSLGGSDVNEATLGKVPAAAQADNASSAGNANTVGGVPAEALTIGRSAFQNACEPGVTTIKCVTVALSLPRPGRVLLNTSGQWHSDDPNGTSLRGLCRMMHNDANLTAATEEGSLAQHTDGNQEQALSGQTYVTGVLAPGDHEFSLACSDDVGDMDFTDTRISAVLLGSS